MSRDAKSASRLIIISFVVMMIRGLVESIDPLGGGDCKLMEIMI